MGSDKCHPMPDLTSESPTFFSVRDSRRFALDVKKTVALAPGRLTEAGCQLQEAKARVREVQEELAALNGTPDVLGFWKRKQDIKKRLAFALRCLDERKVEVRALSGGSGTDPKWVLLAKCHRVLTRLDEADVDIGEDGQDVLDQIEFHVAPALLMRGNE